MFRVARRYRFAASHRLHAPQLSAAENAELYGKCNHPYGHGHDYVLEVVVRGEDGPHGLVVNRERLDSFVERHVLAAYRNRNMNEEIAVFQHQPPTTENVAADIYHRLRQCWAKEFGERPELDAVRIFETRRNLVEYEG